MNAREAVLALASPRDLSSGEAGSVMRSIMAGEATPAQIGAVLTALSMKGAGSQELAGFAGAMREFAVPFPHGMNGPLIDTCGTGGDGSRTFNVSTAAAFVVAGAGLHRGETREPVGHEPLWVGRRPLGPRRRA